MVNGEVMGTPMSALTLARAGAAPRKAAAGLLADEEACCYRLDFK
jgi:hypothetical protein